MLLSERSKTIPRPATDFIFFKKRKVVEENSLLKKTKDIYTNLLLLGTIGGIQFL